MNYNITTTDVKKVSVVVTRLDLWTNYVMTWMQLAFGGESDTSTLNEVQQVLCCNGVMNTAKLRELFRRGDTCMLLEFNVMKHFDTDADILREVLVIDCNDVTHVISHRDINF